jgi:tRNA threonylcarbamoyladenosine biosynthesis protein TsaE
MTHNAINVKIGGVVHNLGIFSMSPLDNITIRLDGSDATRKLGIDLGRSLAPGSIICLDGDLGAGKTTLIQGIGEGLGITEPIDSPTFTLINEYFSGRIPLYHLDLYRLEPSEINQLNLESYWQGIETPLGIVAIEWADKLTCLPDNYLRISLSYVEAEARQVKLTTIGTMAGGSLARGRKF